MPAISVVIPTFARPDKLKRAILSVCRQTYTDFEIIVVRDGVDEGTVEAVASFADSRIRVVALETKVGGAEARNVGAREATGRWIALLDDDDEWLPEKLARQVAIASAQADTNYVVTTFYFYSRVGEKPQIWPGHAPAPLEPLSEFLFSSRGGFQTSVYLVPRELFLKNPFTPGLRKHQDWEWFLRLAANPDFRVLWDAEPLSIYWASETPGSSVSTSANWEFSAKWAKDNFALMTPRAYSMFMVRICVRNAAESGASLRDLAGLLRELQFVGNTDARLWLEVLAAFVFPKSTRRALSSWIAPLRQARTGILNAKTSSGSSKGAQSIASH